MHGPQRVEFVTRHFKDLQTIRLAPLPVAILFAPFVAPGPHTNVIVARALVLSYLLGIVGFYRWSTAAIKRRYGSNRLSSDEIQRRMMFHPALFALNLVVVVVQSWFYFFDRPNYHWEVYALSALVTRMLQPVLDATNPASRRLVWAIGLVALFGAGSFLIRSESEAIFLLAGVVWLSISIFDFLLLRRTFEEISESPSGGATEVVADFG